jgi:hypothetical protein
MSLAGQGVVAIWNGITPEGRSEFYEWHNREHMPERVGIAGFRRGRRYRAIQGSPEFFTLYETDTPEVLASNAYLARLNDPTPWTRRAIPGFIDTSRSLCRVALSLGTGQGGLLLTWRYDVAPGREAEQRHLLVEEVLPRLAEAPGVVGVHLCIADRDASSVVSEEKKDLPQPLIPNWVILVEGGSDPDLLTAAGDAALPAALLIAAGAVAPIERGLYQVQNTRSKDAG